MKIKIIKFSLLIIGTFIALWITEYVIINTMKECKEETIGKINGIMNHTIDAEITIWGASTANVNFNPQIIIDSLNLSCMNMGIDGTNIDQYAGLLNEFIDFTSKSKSLVIAIDIHSGLANRDSFYHFYKWLHHVKNDNIYNCFSDIDYERMFKIKYIPFYSLTQFDKHAFPYFIRTIRNKNNQISNYGFSPLNGTILNSANDGPNFETFVNTRAFDKVNNAVKKASSKGIKCYIVITPCYEKGFLRIINRNEFISKLKTIDVQNAEVFDFSNCYISKDPKYFRDNTHLNSIGANELTKLFLKKMKSPIQ